MVDDKLIKGYFLSSRFFACAESDGRRVCLQSLLEVVEESGGGLHLQGVVAPFNILNADMLLELAHKGKTAFQIAKSRGLLVIADSPLSPMMLEDGDPLELTSPVACDKSPEEVAKTLNYSFKVAITHEQGYDAISAQSLTSTPKRHDVLWGHILHAKANYLTNLARWSRARHGHVSSHLQGYLQGHLHGRVFNYFVHSLSLVHSIVFIGLCSFTSFSCYLLLRSCVQYMHSFACVHSLSS
jgi:hypothetical protein